ncbi:Chitin binding protein [Methanosarcina barkeri MS]|uniref:Chitin binding protein n=1 Tax=Methanosarcina barkeri MS TaxID=1434108 RepID=A0A0E3QS83_METBA|nr:Chitin binding protein [Methanosarcina barkeri MS]
MSTASADTAESVLPTITETRITTSGSASDPDIYNDIIAWVDYRNGNNDVYMYNISTKEEIKIPTNGSANCPCIYGDKIVWEDDSHMLPSWDLSDIHMYDLSTKKETQIPARLEEFVAEGQPDIYGDKIVWQDLYDEDWGVSMYDLSTKEETLISHDALCPAIYGNRIVYYVSHPRKGTDSNIYMYDLSTKKETQITTSGSADCPAIYGNRIVYSDDRKGNYDIYMYDLSTKKETQITSSPDNQVSPDIYGNRILWKDDGGEDDGGEYHGIYMCDLSTNQKFKITSRGSKSDPAIYGNTVVYTDDHNGKSDIYMSTISSKGPGSVPPVAAFSAAPTTGKAPLKVKFTDKSTGTPTKWIWDFGDGSKSFHQNPTHKYSKAGVYTVSLTVKNAAGSNTVTKTEYIKVITKPVAAFSASSTSGKVPLKVKFTDTSTGTPTKWKWDFGDGSKSYHQNPTHKYSKAGVYTVSLTVKNAKGSNTVTKSKYITVTAKPVAAFSASPTSGKSPLNVKFTDKSTGTPTKWKWDFGDGTKSFHQNPTHKYSKAGKYTVTLKVTNAAGINTATKSKYITVTGTSQAPTADFWGWPLSGKAPLKVKFTETSKGSPTSWKWDFGDGKYSTEKSPTHTYSAAGTYTVKLIATNEAGSSTKLKWKYIKVAK